MENSQSLLRDALLFCDGASRKNPGPAGWAFILAIRDRVIESGGAHPEATNNQMELLALVQGLRRLLEEAYEGKLECYLDSQYVLHGARDYLRNWKKNNWKTKDGKEIKNRELWESLDQLMSSLNNKVQMEWIHVRGHRGIPANERCDQIASDFADGKTVSLYEGPLREYPMALKLEREDMKAYASPVYLSLINGKLYRDESWKTCEARIRGQKAVKYKKVHNPIEEKEVLRKWGYE